MGRLLSGATKRVNTGFTIDPALLKEFDAMIGNVPRSTCLSNLITHVVKGEIPLERVLG